MSLIEKSKQLANGAKILVEWIGSGGVPVDKELAQARADVCLKCSKHDLNFGITEIAAGVIAQQIELKNHLKLRVSGERSLHTCSVCGCALRLKVHVPLHRILPEPTDNFPPECWLMTEQKL